MLKSLATGQSQKGSLVQEVNAIPGIASLVGTTDCEFFPGDGCLTACESTGICKVSSESKKTSLLAAAPL